MTTITLKISDNTKEKMKEYFIDKKREKTPPYAVFQADESDTVVTVYESGKAVFQGVSADIDANMWSEMEQNLNPGSKLEIKNSDNKEAKEKKEIFIDPKIYYSTSIGSDEVGTGDYFGPIVVTSAYVRKEDIPFLQSLGVNDSKKITDTKILEIVPKLIKTIPYSTFILSNSEYNKIYDASMNMNKIKAVLHNKVLLELTSKYPNTDYVVVDQFAKPFVYYNYLKTTPNVYRKITFMTKAESKCLSVAVASMISRYIFIKEFDKLGDKVDMFLPKGASNAVDEAAVKIVKKFGISKLEEMTKLNFKNTEKVNEIIKKGN